MSYNLPYNNLLLRKQREWPFMYTGGFPKYQNHDGYQDKYRDNSTDMTWWKVGGKNNQRYDVSQSAAY